MTERLSSFILKETVFFGKENYMHRYGKRIIFSLMTLLLTVSPLTAFAAGKAEAITFSGFSDVELQRNDLAEKGDNKLVLIENGKTPFSIVIPEDCSGSLREAAGILQNTLQQMSGAGLPVVTENQAENAEYTIRLDAVQGTERPGNEELADGYRLVIDDTSVSICGLTQTGTRNGVYAFMENQLGCLFLTPDDTYVPQHTTVCLEKTEITDTPATLWRDVYAYETAQNHWAAKLRLNGIDVESDDTDKTIEQLQYEGWGTWCHDCYDYLSPDDYFDEHPEYFSEKNGERVYTYEGRDAYLCLSNPEVFEIVRNSLAGKIAENPDQLYWDFSGNDNYALAGCECAECKAADKAAGGTGMGTLLPFLNKLAKAFPDKYISTLAYLHTLKAPKNITAEPNVVIKLCSMPGDQAVSYQNGGNQNALQFKEQVEEWSKITDKIVVWDYVVDFAHLLLPFPNFAVQAQNQKFYEDNKIIGVFHQASREHGGEFACLRAYVLSRLMWEGSDFDVAECVSRYVSAYYGAAASKILEYMNLCASELSAGDKTLGLYDGLFAHYKGYLSEANVRQYQELIAEAKEAVSGDAELTNRVEEIELSVVYATVLLPEITEEERQTAVSRLRELCGTHDISMVCEWESLDDFLANTLTGTVTSSQKALKKPYIIGASVAGGVVLAAAAAAVLVKTIRKKKQKAD